MTIRSAVRTALGVTVAAALLEPSAAMASGASSPPAGGAALGQVIGASAAAAMLTGALLVLGLGHRSGRLAVLGRVAHAARRFPPLRELPVWAGLPVLIATVSLLTAVFGMYWDISLHIDNGRDPGPLANPAHYFILAGLFGLFAAGWLALVLPERRPGKAALRLTRDWHVPVSGVMLMACGSFALIGFPLDDIWHRLFGQDVTLWGPTHLMLIGGAGLSLVGVLGLIAEGRAAWTSDAGGDARTGAGALGGGRPGSRRGEHVRRGGVHPRSSARGLRLVMACGGLLVGLSVYQGEYDFGVEQFRLLFQPVLIAMAGSAALVAARALGPRGTALGAAAFFIIVRGALALLVGGALGEITPHLPLYLPEAVAVEAVALVINPARPYRFAAVAGAAVGSIGVLGEWVWSQAWLPVAWPAHLLGDAIEFSIPVAVAAAVLGAYLAGALRMRPDLASTRRAWAAAAASLIVIGATVAYLLQTSVPSGARATVTLAQVAARDGRRVQATVRFTPASMADHADWLDVTAWQGRQPAIVQPLQRLSEGAYRTTAPIPVYGRWKTMIRLHRGGTMASVPVYLPADAAIPVLGVPASAEFQRGFAPDRSLLQRERKRGVPGWLWSTAGSVVLGLYLGLLILLGWGLARLGAANTDRRRPATAARPASARPVTSGA
jgi:hypothetical protein